MSMKRITLVAALTLLSLATLAQAETVPYTSDMRVWTAIDANNDGITWRSLGASDFDGSGYGSGVGFLHSTAELDDWIVSPPVSLEAGAEYIVHFTHKRESGASPRKANLFAAIANDAENLAAGVAIADFRFSASKEWVRIEQTFNPTESGDYHFGLYVNTAYGLGVYLTGFEVKKHEFVPKPVSDLTISPGADFAVEATLSWTLPTEDTDGFVFADDAALNAVYIYHDGELVQTLPGNATAWTDSEASGMTAADHTYEVEVELNGVRSARSSIGYTSPRSLPYLSDFNDGGWTIIDVGNDGNTWGLYKYMPVGEYSNSAVCRDRPFYTTQEDWLISPPLPLTANVAYSIKFLYINHSNYSRQFSLFASRSNNVEELFHGTRIADMPTSHYETEALYTFTPTESDYYYLGFRAAPDRLTIMMSGLEVTSPSITSVGEAAEDGSMHHVGDTVVFPDGAADIMLVTVSGQVVRRCAAADSIDLSQLAPGVYIVSCNLGGKRDTLKIAK